jgi:hypothetical protein
MVIATRFFFLLPLQASSSRYGDDDAELASGDTWRCDGRCLYMILIILWSFSLGHSTAALIAIILQSCPMIAQTQSVKCQLDSAPVPDTGVARVSPV